MLGHSFVCIGRTMKLVVGKCFNFITSEAERIEAFGDDTTQMSGFSLIWITKIFSYMLKILNYDGLLWIMG